MVKKKDTSYEIIKGFFNKLDKKVDSVNFFFHPDQDALIVVEYNEENPDIFLPELDELIQKSGAEYEAKYKIFKKHVSPILKQLHKEKFFKHSPLEVTIQYVDGDAEIVLNIKGKKTKKSLFPEPEDYSFDLSMISKGSGKKQWWYSYDPNSQSLINPDHLPTKEGGPRPYQCLLDPKDKYDGYTLSKGVSQKENKALKNIQLISDKKIKKLWDYESSDLNEIFSSRFCQMLQHMGVSNVEYYPVTTTCKTTGESSKTYYQLAVIVGLTEGVLFFDRKENKQRTKSLRVDKNFDHIRAKKNVMDKCPHKIIRCAIKPSAVLVDNDIKEAVEANGLTGFMFKAIPFYDAKEFK